MYVVLPTFQSQCELVSRDVIYFSQIALIITESGRLSLRPVDCWHTALSAEPVTESVPKAVSLFAEAPQKALLIPLRVVSTVRLYSLYAVNKPALN